MILRSIIAFICLSFLSACQSTPPPAPDFPKAENPILPDILEISYHPQTHGKFGPHQYVIGAPIPQHAEYTDDIEFCITVAEDADIFDIFHYYRDALIDLGWVYDGEVKFTYVDMRKKDTFITLRRGIPETCFYFSGDEYSQIMFHLRTKYISK